MESDADRLESIKALGGQFVNSDRGNFWAIFDRQYDSVAMGDLDVESRSPALTCCLSDATSRVKDELVIAKEGEFRILRIEPDQPSPGWAVIRLKS